MLTKEEREEIAERANEYTYVTSSIYEVLFGNKVPYDTTARDDNKAIVDRILDLCDTSNMLELPRDKDGEVIHIGDVVYDNSGMEWEVGNIRFPIEGASIYVCSDDDYSTFRPDELTHKKPVTAHKNPVIIASLARQIRDILDYEDDIPLFVVKRLSCIAYQLERLGDSDD